MGALSAINACPEFEHYYDRKINEGKKHLQVLNAVKIKCCYVLRLLSINKKIMRTNIRQRVHNYENKSEKTFG
jgi:hypothetical protein